MRSMMVDNGGGGGGQNSHRFSINIKSFKKSWKNYYDDDDDDIIHYAYVNKKIHTHNLKQIY